MAGDERHLKETLFDIKLDHGYKGLMCCVYDVTVK